MALETLKGVKRIDGFDVLNLEEAKKLNILCNDNGDFDWALFDDYRERFPISISDELNAISFKIQNGPVKENGVNGCQVDTILKAAMIIVDKLNEQFPCKENDMAVSHMTQAYDYMKARKANREARGVEGKNEL